ncbi:MAG: AlwI family type II restriction endonuclease [Saprospiraceae bacterium]|nr:AlwI family type II restriction endonuclease [Saprospiraceae bacterium]
MPVSVAKGGVADIEAEYDGFKSLVEVTTSTGETQYKMEGEPVARHFGSVQRNTPLPVYCLFISPQINRSTLSYFFVTNRTSIDFYGGLTRIVPLDLLRWRPLAKRKPFFRLASSNFSPNMPDFDCKICLASRKNDNPLHSKPSTATSL